jgi:outer membrane protein assembly factor BamB
MGLAGAAARGGPTPWAVAWELPLPCDPDHVHFVDTDGPWLVVCVLPDGYQAVDRETGAVAWRTDLNFACPSAKVLYLGDRVLVFSGHEDEAALLRVPSGEPIWRRPPPPFFDWEEVWPLTGQRDGSGVAAPDGQCNRFLFLAREATNRPRERRLDIMEADGSVRVVTDDVKGWEAYLGGDEAYLVYQGTVRALDLATGQSALRLRYAAMDDVPYRVFPDGPRICVAGPSGIFGIDPAQGRMLWEVPPEAVVWPPDPSFSLESQAVLAENCLAVTNDDGLTLVETTTGEASSVTGMKPLTWARPVVAGEWVYALAKGRGSRSRRLWRVNRQSLTAEVVADLKGSLPDDLRVLQADPSAAYVLIFSQREGVRLLKLAPAK